MGTGGDHLHLVVYIANIRPQETDAHIPKKGIDQAMRTVYVSRNRLNHNSMQLSASYLHITESVYPAIPVCQSGVVG